MRHDLLSTSLRHWADAVRFATASNPTPYTMALAEEAADVLDELVATLTEVRDNLGGSLQQMALGCRVDAALAMAGFVDTDGSVSALAAGAGTAETNEDLAQSEGRQSGGEAVTPNPSHIPLMNKDER